MKGIWCKNSLTCMTGFAVWLVHINRYSDHTSDRCELHWGLKTSQAPRHIQIYKQLFKEMSSFLYGLFASPRTVCPGFCPLLDPRTPGKDGWDK